MRWMKGVSMDEGTVEVLSGEGIFKDAGDCMETYCESRLPQGAQQPKVVWLGELVVLNNDATTCLTDEYCCKFVYVARSGSD